MRTPLVARLALALSVALLAAGPAHAGRNVIHLSGHTWETGGFPSSEPGDVLEGVGVVNQIVSPLYWSPDIFSYTWHAFDLASPGESVYGSTRVVEYLGGRFMIHVDWQPSNHDYGIFPPNATSPSTFTDGHATYLEAMFTSFTLTYNTATSSGSFVGALLFTAGNAFPQLQTADGWTVGADISGVSPAGYDLQVNGTVFVDGPLPVQQETWGSLKALYR